MWYFPLLQPMVDHVPVKADLSDLEERIRWCRANDGKCKQIAQSCRRLYDRFISDEGVLDYWQMACAEICRRTLQAPSWVRPVDLAMDGDEERR